MSCSEFDDLLQRYLDGELFPSEEGSVRRHVGACARCEGELRRAAEEWTALVGASAPEAPALRVAERVRGALSAAPAADGAPVRWRRVAGISAAAAALAAALVLALRSPTRLVPAGALFPVAAACLDPCAVPFASGACALPEANCGIEVQERSPHCRVSLASCSTRFATPSLGDFEVSGTGRIDVWVLRPGEAEAALPPHILAIRAATGAQGIVLTRDGEVRVANARGAVQSMRSVGILLLPGAAPQAFAPSPLY